MNAIVLNNKKKQKGYTLAEILITLGTIGIIAALVLPALITNYKKQVYMAKLKQSYSILYNMIKLSETENGNYSQWVQPSNTPSSTKIFAEKYILPYIFHTETGKDNLFYTNEELYYIKLVNGTTVALHVGSCLDFLVDVNGDKLPNKGGVDQYTFYLNIFQNQGFPEGFSTGIKLDSRNQYLTQCKNSPRNCTSLIIYDNWKIQNDYPHKF